MGRSPVAAVHTKSTDRPNTTGSTGCIVVPLGGSENAVMLHGSTVSSMYIHIGGVLHRQEVGPSSHLADDNIL